MAEGVVLVLAELGDSSTFAWGCSSPAASPNYLGYRAPPFPPCLPCFKSISASQRDNCSAPRRPHPLGDIPSRGDNLQACSLSLSGLTLAHVRCQELGNPIISLHGMDPELGMDSLPSVQQPGGKARPRWGDEVAGPGR